MNEIVLSFMAFTLKSKTKISCINVSQNCYQMSDFSIVTETV